MRERVRAFFAASDALEVETPLLCRTVPAEAAIQPVTAAVDGHEHWLRTSPESAMKRLLAAGIGDCWQLGPVFRDGEEGTHHQPEFTLLEWYRVGFDHHELMDEVEALVAAACAGERTVPVAARWRWRDAFVATLDVDPLVADVAELRRASHEAGAGAVTGLAPDDRTGWLDWLLAAVVVPRLSAEIPLFLHGWPIGQAALARAEDDDPALAARFELYWQGVELANGFRELTDGAEQRRRLEAERSRMARQDEALPPLDEPLLAALDAGLPDAAGVALGFDRLVMLAAGVSSLDQVMAFSFRRA